MRKYICFCFYSETNYNLNVIGPLIIQFNLGGENWLDQIFSSKNLIREGFIACVLHVRSASQVLFAVPKTWPRFLPNLLHIPTTLERKLEILEDFTFTRLLNEKSLVGWINWNN